MAPHAVNVYFLTPNINAMKPIHVHNYRIEYVTGVAVSVTFRYRVQKPLELLQAFIFDGLSKQIDLTTLLEHGRVYRARQAPHNESELFAVFEFYAPIYAMSDFRAAPKKK